MLFKVDKFPRVVDCDKFYWFLLKTQKINVNFNKKLIELRKSKRLSQNVLIKGVDVQDVRNKI